MKYKEVVVLAAIVLVGLPAVAFGSGLLYVDDNGNVGIGTITPQAKLDVAGAMYSELVTATSSTIDWGTGNVQNITLSSNETLAFLNGHAGGQYSLIIHQDATGGRLVTWPASVAWENRTIPTLTSTASATDIASFVYDGSYYLGSLTTDYGPVAPATTTVNYLVVAGGGAGGAGSQGDGVSGAGGGGGGVLAGSASITSGIAYSINVGTGGTGGTFFVAPSDGSPSSFGIAVTATGGGRGAGVRSGSGPYAGANGGSGGGGWSSNQGSGTIGQGNDGGSGVNSTFNSAGGGGGAGAIGGNSAGANGAAGGAGTTSSISGSSTVYGGGGGGGGSSTCGTGGSGGGGSSNCSTGNGDGGSANTGGGGGGSVDRTNTSGDGGSGIVIISAPIGTIASATGGAHTTSGGNDIWTFTSSGTWTPSF